MEKSNSIDLFFGIATGMMALIIITTGFIMVYVRYKRKLQMQQAALHQEAIRHKEMLLISNIQSVEAERSRIARDIHDELGGIFSTLSLTMNQLQMHHTSDVLLVENGKQLISAGLKSVRRIAHAILPDELALFGLDHTLEHFFCSINQTGKINISYCNEAGLEAIDQGNSLAIYRIMQELVSNTLKHAQATEISIKISVVGQQLEISYADNGVGMVPTVQHSEGGMGMKNIESRLIFVNGRIEFPTTKAAGYQCLIHIPINKK